MNEKRYTPAKEAVEKWQAEADAINAAVEANRVDIQSTQERINKLQGAIGALRTKAIRLGEQRDKHARKRPEGHYTKPEPYCVGEYPTYFQPNAERNQ